MLLRSGGFLARQVGGEAHASARRPMRGGGAKVHPAAKTQGEGALCALLCSKGAGSEGAAIHFAKAGHAQFARNQYAGQGAQSYDQYLPAGTDFKQPYFWPHCVLPVRRRMGIPRSAAGCLLDHFAAPAPCSPAHPARGGLSVPGGGRAALVAPPAREKRPARRAHALQRRSAVAALCDGGIC